MINSQSTWQQGYEAWRMETTKRFEEWRQENARRHQQLLELLTAIWPNSQPTVDTNSRNESYPIQEIGTSEQTGSLERCRENGVAIKGYETRIRKNGQPLESTRSHAAHARVENSAVNDKQDKESLKLLVSVSDVPSNPRVVEGNAALSSENAKQLPSRCSDLDGDSVEALKETYKISTSADDLGNFKENHGVSKNTENECGDELAAKNYPSSPIQGVLRTKLPETYDKFDNEPSSTSELQADSAMLSQINIDAESSVTASVTDAINEQLWEQDVAEVGEGELESKERFRQRLWCFLFENLNRAVDELYLLCELECDREQMDEAILVLEEATSDFRELKCRVEHFDNTKKYSFHSPKDGMAMTVKADHRRPHALSWEVGAFTS